MKGLITLASVLLSVLAGLPCLLIASVGTVGILADASYSENLRFAAPYLAIATLILVPSVSWIRALLREFREEQ